MGKKKFQIIITNTDDEFYCLEDQTVLASMEKLGKKGIPSGCRGGGCGVCKARVITGTYRCKKMSKAHVTDLEEDNGYILACRCHPQSNITLDVVGKMKKSLY